MKEEEDSGEGDLSCGFDYKGLLESCEGWSGGGKRRKGGPRLIVYNRRMKPRGCAQLNGFRCFSDALGEAREEGSTSMVKVDTRDFDIYGSGVKAEQRVGAKPGEVDEDFKRDGSYLDCGVSDLKLDRERCLVEVIVKEDCSGVIAEGPVLCSARLSGDGFEGELVDVVIQEGSLEQGSLVFDTEDRKIREPYKMEGTFLSDEASISNNVKIDRTTLDAVIAREVDESSVGKMVELKTSKKATVGKKLFTVRDLFETGLLDGVTVVYMGGPCKTSGLRGTIRDGGILCSCTLCNGRRVIPPSQFEIHACKVYRRAAQYICLENGKSLLDVLKICRAVPLHKLEDTVQNLVHSLPVDKFFSCRACKGTFLASSVAKVGPLCHTCVELKKAQSTESRGTSAKHRSARTVRSLELSPSSMVSSSLGGSDQLMVKTWSSNRLSMSTSLQSSLTSASYPEINQSNITVKSSGEGLISRPSRGGSPCISSQNKLKLKRKRKSIKSVSTFRISKTTAESIVPEKKGLWKITIKDQRLHKLVFEEDGLPDGSEVAYYVRGKKLLEGYKKGLGIFCRCCNCEVSPSQFEAHAGWATRRKPYSNIYTSNGVSLHELAISLSKGRKYSSKDNDNLCIICAEGGNLVLCDGCPRAFHKECASLTSIPRGDWYCNYCQNMFQREKFVNVNSVAAGRVSGVDPIEQITKRCIRIVKNIGAEISGCALCRCYDFSKSGFGPRTIILCDQCEKEFHVGCLREHKIANLRELPQGDWFCSVDCSRIHSTLHDLIVRGSEKLQESLLNVIRKKHEERGLEKVDNIDVRWRLLSGNLHSLESRRLLSEAVAIFHECFDPIVDVTTGRDLIPAMVYGRSTRGQEYGGMYCAVLIVNSVVVSAGILRIFGQDMAELPLVATRKSFHDKGYFQLLFSCIEKLLEFLTVRSLVLPAAVEAESIWTDKFGFARMESDQVINYRRLCSQMITFKGTSMLQKSFPALGVIGSETL
ncbi:hypothetical protein MLD38_020359 [Melastoma candidum]|uniref:Uncharacterized protein n=1 Tax=Melastoma candidum TaxID=119954 RepID=A0ACB9QDW6_9MYRT|nr:hypothetical protein MLD38_020359 [Melastoma candidum]